MKVDASNSKIVPDERALLSEFDAMTGHCPILQRSREASDTGIFLHPDGRQEILGDEVFSEPQLALLAHLAARCSTRLSIEVGFGKGSSAMAMLASRRQVDPDFEHIVFDPWGVGHGGGEVAQSFIENEFPQFRRIWQRSEIGLAELYAQRGGEISGLIFIDGGHLFDNVIVDFVLASLLCVPGGYIVFDDAYFPAIETTINYIRSNRPDFSVQHLPVRNTTVVQKTSRDVRYWDTFSPFDVPDRKNWESIEDVMAQI